MALQSSGAISLNDVNVEIGAAGTAVIAMNDSNVRSLFQVTTGAISMSDGYGKSAQLNLHITSTQTDTNLRTYAINNGWTGSGVINVYIDSGVWVYSDVPGNTALVVDGTWPQGLTLYNNGIIMGMGGNGTGSDAMSSVINITMYSTNYILGGGGQGGNGGGGGAGGGLSSGAGVGFNSANSGGNAAGGRNPLGSNTPNSTQTQKYGGKTAYGGGAGGGGQCYWDCQGWQAVGGYGGGNANNGGPYVTTSGTPVSGWGGGGGYGATGGTGRSNNANVGGNAGGRGIRLSGSGAITWPNGQPNSLIRGGVGA